MSEPREPRMEFERKRITRQEFLQVQGLLALAVKNYKRLRECEAAILDVLGPDAEDRISDQIYGDEDFDAERLLKSCKIEVTDAN